MGQIILSNNDIEFLRVQHPKLRYSLEDNSISGNLEFDLTYTKNANKSLKGSYSIYFKLETAEGSVLPSVFETENKIVNIAKRKKIRNVDVHLFNINGELCIIHPLCVKVRYPNGFDLVTFLHHLQEHFYWVTYFDRYNVAPWAGQSHGDKCYVELFWQAPNIYSQGVKEYFEQKLRQSLSRPEFRRLMKQKKKEYNL